MRTPIGTAVYPHLSQPDTKFNEDGEYHTKLRIPMKDASELLETLESLYETEYKKICKEKKKQKLKRFDFPWTEELDDEGNETGNVLLKLKMKAKTKEGQNIRPLIVDSKREPMAEMIGSGSQLKVAFNPWCWFVPMLGVGMTLRIQGVQVLDLVEYSSGRSGKDLFEDEDGFETVAGALEDQEEQDDSPVTSKAANDDDGYDF